MNLEQYQNSLAEILLAPELRDHQSLSQQMQLPTGSVEREVSLHAAEVRLNIYRNNVIFSLTQALAAQFSVVQALVGESFFLALARDYVRSFPPQEAALVFYGQTFPDFIHQHQHCQTLPYLTDIARLEWHHQCSLHAEDDLILKPEELAVIKPDLLADLLLPLQSSVRLLASSYPVVRIRKESLKEQSTLIDLASAGASTVLIFRRDMEVSIINLDADAFYLLKALGEGKTINQAWLSTQEQHSSSEEDLSTAFSFLLALGVFKSFEST